MTDDVQPPPRRRGVLAPTVFAIVGIAILAGLGVWQLDRKAWKESITDRVTARLAGPPSSGLPPRERWPQLDRDEFEFRRVSLPLEFVSGEEALVYTSGSSFRPDVSGPGYWVFAPARLPGGSTVVVNRGFIPFDRKDPATRRDGVAKGVFGVVGVLHWPETRALFTPADEPQNNLWYIRDPRAIAQAKGWGEVAPFFIDQEAPQPPGGLPRAGPTVVRFSNNHLQYAVTWFGLALTLAGVYLAWMIARRRRMGG